MVAVTPDAPDTSDVPPDGRRSVAIAFADVVGYSILVAADELGTLERWMGLYEAAIAPMAHSLGGRIVEVLGDGVLAEFPDVSAALAWAEAVHVAAAARLAESPGLPPITLRVAIHFGPVLKTARGIFGNAVNLTARLQEYAPPGGIVLSEEARIACGGLADRKLRELGTLPLRGIARAVHAHALDPAQGGVPVPLPPPPRHLPSVAVLPLINVGGDPSDDYLTEGIVEDVTASLAALREMFVISPDSARMFRGQRPDPLRVGRTLGVRYVLSGTLRRGGGALRVALQLADTATGETLWGERIDAAEREIFDLQDQVVAGIVAGIAPNLRAASLREALRKRPESLSAYDLTLQALHVLGTLDRAGFAEGRRLLERAMAEDPFFALPRAWAARWHSISIARGWSANMRADAGAAIMLADRAIALDGSNALALATRGHIFAYLRRDCDAAMENFRRALAAAPSNSVAWTLSSTTLSYLGRAAEAVEHAERGLRLSPYDPLSFSQHFVLGLAQYGAGDLARAEGACRMSLGAHAQHAATWKLMAAVLAGQGRRDAAAEAGARVMALEPSFRLGTYERDRLPIQDPALRGRIMRDLREARLPG